MMSDWEDRKGCLYFGRYAIVHFNGIHTSGVASVDRVSRWIVNPFLQLCRIIHPA